LIHYRSFLNSDPPHLAKIWRSQPALRGRFQNVTPEMLEQLVFVKQYFDHDGLIVAVDDERPVGFVHAGFESNHAGTGICAERGVICALLVESGEARNTIAAELLKQGESYLRDRGAKQIGAGGVGLSGPFYLGLYGGSQLPGILSSDSETREILESSGYHEVGRRVVFQRSLSGFRAVISRRQIQNRRQFRVIRTPEPRAANWWEANAFAHVNREQFSLISLMAKQPVGSAMFWQISPLSDEWGARAAGLLQLEIAEQNRRQGLATFLVCEAMQQLVHAGFTLAEVQTAGDDYQAMRFVESLAFEKIDEGLVLRKSA